MRNKKNFSPPVVGGSSLIVIFAVLCLTVFALLSLNTVLADERLTNASVNAVTNYYNADSEAEEIFAKLRSGEICEGVSVEGNIFSYSCGISDTQSLDVELLKNGDTWTVLKWQSVSDVEYYETTLPVWTGETIN